MKSVHEYVCVEFLSVYFLSLVCWFMCRHFVSACEDYGWVFWKAWKWCSTRTETCGFCQEAKTLVHLNSTWFYITVNQQCVPLKHLHAYEIFMQWCETWSTNDSERFVIIKQESVQVKPSHLYSIISLSCSWIKRYFADFLSTEYSIIKGRI